MSETKWYDKNHSKTPGALQGRDKDGQFTEDTIGSVRSEAQEKFFKESKIRDENGNLLVMYHGTPNGNFEEFKPGSYFTSSKEYAEKYTNPNKSSVNNKFYEKNDNPKIYEVYLNIKNPFDLKDKEAKRIFIEEYINGGYSASIAPGTYNSISKLNGIDWTEGENLLEFLLENHPEYDGMIINEGGAPDNNGGAILYGDSVVPFHSNQIKDINNANPTEGNNIYDTAKEYKISQKQLNSIPSYYFKDFKVTTVNIEDLVGNAIKDKNAGVYQRRSERWGKTLEDYHYDEEKDDWKYEPIMIDGSGKLIDGNHRLLALYNDGYRTAEVLAPKTYKDEQKQAMKLFGLNKGE